MGVYSLGVLLYRLWHYTSTIWIHNLFYCRPNRSQDFSVCMLGCMFIGFFLLTVVLIFWCQCESPKFLYRGFGDLRGEDNYCFLSVLFVCLGWASHDWSIWYYITTVLQQLEAETEPLCRQKNQNYETLARHKQIAKWIVSVKTSRLAAGVCQLKHSPRTRNQSLVYGMFVVVFLVKSRLEQEEVCFYM